MPTAPLKLLTNWELWAVANRYVVDHGEDAGMLAAARCEELVDAQDFDGALNYFAILGRITQILDVTKGVAN